MKKKNNALKFSNLNIVLQRMMNINYLKKKLK